MLRNWTVRFFVAIGADCELFRGFGRRLGWWLLRMLQILEGLGFGSGP